MSCSCSRNGPWHHIRTVGCPEDLSSTTWCYCQKNGRFGERKHRPLPGCPGWEEPSNEFEDNGFDERLSSSRRSLSRSRRRSLFRRLGRRSLSDLDGEAAFNTDLENPEGRLAPPPRFKPTTNGRAINEEFTLREPTERRRQSGRRVSPRDLERTVTERGQRRERDEFKRIGKELSEAEGALNRERQDLEESFPRHSAGLNNGVRLGEDGRFEFGRSRRRNSPKFTRTSETTQHTGEVREYLSGDFGGRSRRNPPQFTRTSETPQLTDETEDYLSGEVGGRSRRNPPQFMRTSETPQLTGETEDYLSGEVRGRSRRIPPQFTRTSETPQLTGEIEDYLGGDIGGRSRRNPTQFAPTNEMPTINEDMFGGNAATTTSYQSDTSSRRRGGNREASGLLATTAVVNGLAGALSGGHGPRTEDVLESAGYWLSEHNDSDEDL